MYLTVIAGRGGMANFANAKLVVFVASASPKTLLLPLRCSRQYEGLRPFDTHQGLRPWIPCLRFAWQFLACASLGSS